MGVVRDVSQCESPGPAPLAIIIRPTIMAATAVAARIVKNQNRRLPCSTKSFAFCRSTRVWLAAAATRRLWP